MGNKIQTSYFFQTELAISYVESQLKKPVSKKAFGSLFAKLEHAQKNCENEGQIRTIQSLYKKIVDKYVATEVEVISLLVKKPVVNRSLTLKKIEDLKNFGLSIDQHNTLSAIQKTLKKGSDSIFPSRIPFTSFEEAEELFNLAGFIYHDELAGMENAKNKLSFCAKKALQKHLIIKKIDFLEDKLLTIQSLFAAAYELSGRDCAQYPSKKEIKVFFKELKSCTTEEMFSQKDHILPFSPLALDKKIL